jgi:methylated-DNA-[protein]-cysteine S-methyltransferase
MSKNLRYAEFESPIGRLFIEGDEGAVTGLYLPGHKGWAGPADDSRLAQEAFPEVRAQLEQYFDGARRQFDVPLKLAGTPFQERVWQTLREIPYGTTISYVELARRVGRPTASRAVGAANGRNPISILIPCHRVVGTNGGLTGYAGGLDAKRWLLEREARRSRQRVESGE